MVVAANLPSFPSLRCGSCWINGTALQQGVAAMFVGGEDSLNMSATAAGLVGTLPTSFVLSGHSAGGASPPLRAATTPQIPAAEAICAVW